MHMNRTPLRKCGGDGRVLLPFRGADITLMAHEMLSKDVGWASFDPLRNSCNSWKVSRTSLYGALKTLLEQQAIVLLMRSCIETVTR